MSRSKRLSRSRLTCQDGHVVGLDIGATSVRVAVLGLTGSGPDASVRVHAVAGEPLPAGVVVNGVVQDSAGLTRAVRNLWKQAGISCNSVVLGIAGPQVTVRDLPMPAVDHAHLMKALPFQARDVVALPMDEVVLDWMPLGDPDPVSRQVPGLLIAAPRQPVLAAVRAVERAGPKVARVDLASFAMLRASAHEHGRVEAVIDLGAHLTTIIVHRNGVPKLVRTLTRGGQELTERVADKLGVPHDEAEAAKVRTGLTGTSDVSTALSEAARPLLSEIRSSINYFRSGNDRAQLEQITLTGGTALLGGLAELLESQNGAPCALAAPTQYLENWRDPEFEPAHRDDRVATAISVGLALGAAA